MASDILYDEYSQYISDEFGPNGEIFLTGGIMNTKELYNQDQTQSPDASSSDSGISTFDDLQDIANITDLNNILDTDFKELDFSLEYALPMFEQDVFDPDLLIKNEPHSPASPGKHEQIFHDDVMLKDEGSPLTLPECYQMDDSFSPMSSSHSPQQIYTISPSSEGLSPHCESSSPTLVLNSQTLHNDFSFTSSPADLTYIHNQPLNYQSNTNCSQDSPLSTSLPPTSTHSIIVLPSIKKENKISMLPSPREILVSTSGDVKPAPPTTINIDSILNSKVRIKPKPGSEVIIPAGSTQWVSAITNSQIPLSSHQPFSIITPSSAITAGGITATTDDKFLKKAQRIIKNRESASMSRKRKKEYLTSLEIRLQQCRDENEQLLRENEALKQRLESLYKENTGLKYPNMSPAKKICLMCLTLLLVLNLSPFSFMTGPSSTNSQSGISSNHHIAGRHLMSVEDGKVSEYDNGIHSDKDMWSASLLMQFDEELSLLAEKLNLTDKLGNMCPKFFNSTESNRLAEQLRRWMISQEEEKKKTERNQRKKNKEYPPLRRFDSGSINDRMPSASSSEINRPTVTGLNYPVQVFGSGSDPRQHLLNAIPRRNDTFYVLSFSTDYFLVPATAHNKTMRPRMSLLMPVVSPPINETTNQARDSIAVMQIDCEILNTNIIKVHRSAFPEDIHYNSTSHGRRNSGPVDESNINTHSKRGGNKSSEKNPSN